MSSAYSYHIPIVILSLNKPNLSPYYIKVVTVSYTHLTLPTIA